MRKIIAALCLSLIVGTANAEEIDWNRTCKIIEDLAYATMVAKQSGVSLSTLMQNIEEAMDDSAEGEAVRRLASLLVMEAYKEPDFFTEEVRHYQRQAFANRWSLACHQNARELD